jgi:hypothetical protein
MDDEEFRTRQRDDMNQLATEDIEIWGWLSERLHTRSDFDDEERCRA